MLGGKLQNRLTQHDLNTPAADRKVIFVRFSGGKEAHRPRSAYVASVTVSRPMRARDGVNEIGGAMGMARDAQPGWVQLFLHFQRRRFEFTENVPRLTGMQRELSGH